jgi:hypothetical protein
LNRASAGSRPRWDGFLHFNRGNWRLVEPRVPAVDRFVEAFIGPPEPYLVAVEDLARRTA